jgi:hypothetical protein
MAELDRHAGPIERSPAGFALSVERPIATCAVIVDAAEESAAIGVVREVAAAAGWEIVRLGWSGYMKFGPQSRVWFWLRLPPCRTNQDVADAVEAVAAVLVPGPERSGTYVNAFFEDDGALVYNRTLDGRDCRFADPRITWADLEAGTHAGVQADLAVALEG